MQSRHLVELAALAATHGPVLISNRAPLSPTGMQQYWVASKCRLDRWGRALKKYTTVGRDPWPTVRAVLEEIAAGEVLTRLWTGVVCAHDRQVGESDSQRIAQSIWLGHLEARHRALALLVHGPGIEVAEAVAVNRLWRRSECWTDFLLGHLLEFHDVSEFAVDRGRAREFAADLAHERQCPGGQHVWPLMLAALRAAFQSGFGPTSPNADVNDRIASSILSCFPAELFDSTGLVRSLWLTRLTNTTNDAQGMVADLLRGDGATAGSFKPTNRLRTRRQ